MTALAALAGCAPVPPAGDSGPATAQMPNRLAAANGAAAFAETCKDWDDWDKPAPPFQVLGGTWYVGTCGIASILVADPAGHILIDSGTEKGAEVVLANLRTIGVDPRDVRYILASHEHFDHVGGHAALVRATGAKVVSSAAAAEVFRTGRTAASDPQADAGHPAMAPVTVDRIVADGEVIALNVDPLTTQNRLKAHATPGHTAGALSWTWTACNLPDEPPVCRRIAYVDSLSAVSADDYRFTDHPEWIASFRRSFAKVAALPCDILITPHPSGSKLLDRLRANNLETVGQCRDYADRQAAAFDKRLADEKAKGG
ncbi:subclass B3 metallo-beta-lactamase [Tsuneonella dongtanensis]|uniref:subclass B3 metallo-beta-lactamase n=1 Tax=Tsuneonella dongtanensis TaxID=692370 RepID=UPI001E4F8CA0|nr:subclass B3 metallo-beta-lactamase [Tsuneonella dongtanensis]